MEKRIQSVQRAINIMNCFSEEDSSLSLPQISQRLSLNINTVRGLVNTLVLNGLMIHNKHDNTYSLGLYFMEKSNLIHETHHINNFIRIAHPYMQGLTDKYLVFSGLQMVSQDNIFMVKSLQPLKAQYRITAESHSPLTYHCTSSGKLFLQYLSPQKLENILEQMEFTIYTDYTTPTKEALLAELAKQKITLYSTEFDEQALGISSIAAPILRTQNRLFGTVSITAPTQVLFNNFNNIAEDVTKAGSLISKKIQQTPEFM